jgi:hypothetical protein
LASEGPIRKERFELLHHLVAVEVTAGDAGREVHLLGYFVATDTVATPAGQAVVVRPAPEVEITFAAVRRRHNSAYGCGRAGACVAPPTLVD